MIFDEVGRQQQRQAIYVKSIFFVNSPDILLTPRVHDLFRAQGGGSSGGGGGTTITTALGPITMMGCGHDCDLQQGGAAAAAAGYLSWVYLFLLIHPTFF